MDPTAGVRQRGRKKGDLRPDTPTGLSASEDERIEEKPRKPLIRRDLPETGFKVGLALVTLLAFATRFWGITYPDEVVFDEVHFGKFASYYLERTYFFDVHPPFAKLLLALMGWFVGYDGHFKFDNIGDSYITHQVPYVAFRAMSAIQGALTVPVVFLTMWESGYSLPAALTASIFLIFDNAHVGQTRLILLDATLIFSMACSLLCYVRFSKLRNSPFSRKWWKWLLLTGLSLSCVISTKYVGVFTFLTIGAAVAVDLWNLLDYRSGLSMQDFTKHFFARAFGLIIVPFFFYLFWFQVHFAVLYRSGPGDDFMTPQFQETLADNALAVNSYSVNYYDTVQIRHKDTKAFLHSHNANYPLRYDDGRISSQGQQVTGYPYNDTNNHWVIMPAVPFPEDARTGRPIKNGDVVKFHHVMTNTDLLSHDVASPTYPTNQEFTTVDLEKSYGKRHNDTLFEIRIEGAKSKAELRTLSSHIKIIHNPSKVAMWTHKKPLPEWGFQQQEINGNKNVPQTSNIWFIEDIPSLKEDDPRNTKEPRIIKPMPFWKKYLELQRAMFHHNNMLTSSHPYASQPISWPFLLRGVSFWTKNDTREQIYFLGNPVGWWIASSLLAVLAGIFAADQLTQRRGVDALDRRTRSKLYNSTGFFFIAWALHYFPFFLMGRQLFLHHYLPAHLASTLVAGALVEFVFCVDPADRLTATGNRAAPWLAWIASAISWVLVIAGYVFFAPLTYGKPGLSVEGVNARRWLGYELHFAK
ncbi:family 39 glycosyltransferase [Ascodesmis nigricans]|uniref:Dolichyl-phosphate-mannose--protein mannosyltransferase n=1 Tax=Ascodesmis nigricans TaxID=341454 RepID=A0A4S2N8L6_9PEZI|nr:family 39 glycosyltransferase [Ascodesmis nigricans]